MRALIASLVILVGCATPTRLAPIVRAGVLDLRELTADGFLLSWDGFTGPYRTLGWVSVTLQGGATRAQAIDRVGLLPWAADSVAPDSALRMAKAHARALGADGLIHIEIQPAHRDLPTATGPVLSAMGWQVTGLAIQRAGSP